MLACLELDSWAIVFNFTFDPIKTFDTYFLNLCHLCALYPQLSALLGKESVRVLRQSGGSLDMAAGGDQADKKPMDSVTVARVGLFGDEEEARVMPVLRLAVVKDDQVGGCMYDRL